jgi:hypothetical protein
MNISLNLFPTYMAPSFSILLGTRSMIGQTSDYGRYLRPKHWLAFIAVAL